MELFIYLIPIALLTGIFTSYSDIKYSKIKNYILLYSFISTILINLVFAYSIKEVIFFHKAYYFQYFLSVAFMFFISICMWLVGFWNAADSKLLTIFSMLITPAVINYNFSNLYVVNFFYNVIFINVIYLIFRIFSSGKNNIIKKITKNIKFFKKTSLKEYVLIFLTMYSLGFLSNFFSFITNVIDRFYIMILIMIGIVMLMRKLKLWYLFLFLSFLLNTYFNSKNILSVDYWKMIIYLYLIIIFLKATFEALSVFNVDLVKFNDLKVGMHLAQDYSIENIEGKKEVSFLKKIDYDYSVGLTEKNMPLIIKYSKYMAQKEILVSQKDFFAPFVFLGYILTILLRTNLFTYLRVLIGF